MHEFLADLWFFILAFELFMYVILDGMDLGIGVWALFDKNEDHISTSLAIIGPFWDANETWLVMAGGILFGAFPAVYAIGANALYIPIMILIFGLIFRAVAIEFRDHAKNKRLWDVLFGLGSLAAIFGQGFAVGGLFGGIKIGPHGFAGSPWDFLTPFSFILSFGFLFGYMMLGASYTVSKTEGEIQRANYTRVIISAILSTLLTVTGLILLHFLNLPEMKMWFSSPDEYILAILYILAAFIILMIILNAFTKKHEKGLYMWVSLLVIDMFVAGVFEVFPYIVPPNIKIVDVASPDESLIAMLIGIGMVIPVILAYNFYVKKHFRGKVKKGASYY
ncbi:cytochrome d ubiquinol oxidase subunit II [Athalassotoga saccharophila]|uniref:cytochrome d ubiquinol oxidase subunit II n=1 Tax=Athalassotoga saccharophila TaxID=1441386 RepID=UPI00137B7B1D|nr:cytochrome d ubiquinol oxidase subunit II [Athalassotoga saccharophila]BBJ27192.1 cytochrome bd-II ubiquinol oxidase subunit 2 [Athalassotoga saccharophila]